MHAVTYKVENSAQGSSCKLKCVHGKHLRSRLHAAASRANLSREVHKLQILGKAENVSRTQSLAFYSEPEHNKICNIWSDVFFL